MKSRLMKETDAFGNTSYWTEVDEQFIEGSSVYVASYLTTEEKKEKITLAFEKYSQVQSSKGLKTKEVIIENEY